VAAGFGSRLQPLRPGGELIKPLEPVGGTPLLKRVIATALRCGLSRVVVVVGHLAETVVRVVESWGFSDRVAFVHNPRYELSNGVSLLCGARACAGDFVLLMSDHLFQAGSLSGILARGLAGDRAVLAVDRKIAQVFDLDDATKVQTEGDRIVGLGKALTRYDAVDTGLFLVSRLVAEDLSRLVEATGDASISGAMARAIAARSMGAFDIGEGLWQDVDTPEMLLNAERLVRQGIFGGA
jgi:choline kinase